MPLKRNYLALPWAVAAIFAAGCDRQVQQTISGSFKGINGPNADLPLRLYESFEMCEGQYVETRTDELGAFRFRTTSTKGGISEVTQSIALCAERDGRWAPLWSTIIGGGAAAIALECGPPKSSSGEFCEMRIQPSGSAA
jgi:hypothetical protein